MYARSLCAHFNMLILLYYFNLYFYKILGIFISYKYSIRFNLTGHISAVKGMKLVSFDILASGSNDNTIKLWNITSGSLIRTINYTNSILSLVDMLNTQTLVCCTGGAITLSNLTTGERISMVNTIASFRSLAVLSSNIATSK